MNIFHRHHHHPLAHLADELLTLSDQASAVHTHGQFLALVVAVLLTVLHHSKAA